MYSVWIRGKDTFSGELNCLYGFARWWNFDYDEGDTTNADDVDSSANVNDSNDDNWWCYKDYDSNVDNHDYDNDDSHNGNYINDHYNDNRKDNNW